MRRKYYDYDDLGDDDYNIDNSSDFWGIVGGLKAPSGCTGRPLADKWQAVIHPFHCVENTMKQEHIA